MSAEEMSSICMMTMAAEAPNKYGIKQGWRGEKDRSHRTRSTTPKKGGSREEEGISLGF